MKSTNRKIYLDVLRILANFLVLFNHTPEYKLYQYAPNIPTATFYTALALITKINIPIFLMITGALLLGKEEEIGVVFKKRVLRFAILIIAANSMIYFVNTPITEYNLMHWLDACLNCYMERSYWYLYTHLAILLMLPYIRRIASKFTKKDFKYFLAVHFVVTTILPFVDHFMFMHKGVHLQVYPEATNVIMLYQTFFYPLAGYYIDKHVDMHAFSGKKLLPLWGTCIVGVGVVTWLTRVQGLRFGFTEDYFKMFDYIVAITLFLTAKYLFEKREWLKQASFVKGMIHTVAALTLGIYILDPIMKVEVPNLKATFPPNTPLLVTALAWCVLRMAIAAIITYVIRLIPGVKKVL